MESAGVCRDRFGTFSVGVFHVWTCSLCYNYLFPDSPHPPSSSSSSSSPSSFPALSSGMGIASPTGEKVYPDVSNSTSMTMICSWLEEGQCSRWLQCCEAAASCCQRQVASMLLSASSHGTTARLRNGSDVFGGEQGVTGSAFEGAGTGYREGGGIFCPQTWDGFSCLDDTPAGTRASVVCPAYLEQTQISARGYRECTDNGTWWLDPLTGHEWTDYTACVPLQDYHVLYMVGTVCNTVSLLLLVPSCIIFISYRSLRKQHRIRIHINLFLSFLLTNASLLLWENLVYRDRLLNEASDSNMHQDSVSCKVLYFVTRYAWTTTFFWMFLEGFHLYRLISRAFQTPNTILHYYIFGWGAALVPVIAYVYVRASLQHASCWVNNAGPFEWIIYGPELLCILSNVFFFACILRILITEIQSHPNEPSNYRRALRATFFLVPLFGLQLFLVAYSPGPGLAHLAYEVTAKAVSSSQGAVIAVIFCFCNSEVHSQIRDTFSSRCRPYPHNMDLRSMTVSSHMAALDSTRGSYSLPKSGRGSYSLAKSVPRHSHPADTFDHLDRATYISLNTWVSTHPGTNQA